MSKCLWVFTWKKHTQMDLLGLWGQEGCLDGRWLTLQLQPWALPPQLQLTFDPRPTSRPPVQTSSGRLGKEKCFSPMAAGGQGWGRGWGCQIHRRLPGRAGWAAEAAARCCAATRSANGSRDPKYWELGRLGAVPDF